MNKLLIKIDDLNGREIAQLLSEHLHSMTLHSPPESIHALDLNSLRQSDITFWSAWHGDNLAGCGALKELDSRHAEIKSMRTANAYLRQGVAAALLQHILFTAKKRGYKNLSLETGSMDAFKPARALYTKYGFELCSPFANYSEDPNSVFMTLKLD